MLQAGAGGTKCCHVVNRKSAFSFLRTREEYTMTEKEKMQKGILYDANYDALLIEERRKAKALCHEFNSLSPLDEESHQIIMKQLLGKTGENCCITAPFWCDYGYNIEIGDNFFTNHNTVILDCAKT